MFPECGSAECVAPGFTGIEGRGIARRVRGSLGEDAWQMNSSCGRRIAAGGISGMTFPPVAGTGRTAGREGAGVLAARGEGRRGGRGSQGLPEGSEPAALGSSAGESGATFGAGIGPGSDFQTRLDLLQAVPPHDAASRAWDIAKT